MTDRERRTDRRYVISAADWRDAADRIIDSGGRVIGSMDGSVLVVELPEGMQPRDVGTDLIEPAQQTERQRRLSEILLRVQDGREISLPEGRRMSWGSDDSPLAIDGPGV